MTRLLVLAFTLLALFAEASESLESVVAEAMENTERQQELDAVIVEGAGTPDDPVLKQLAELDRRILEIDLSVAQTDPSLRRVMLMRLQKLELERTRLLHGHIKTKISEDQPLDPALIEALRLEADRIRATLRRLGNEMSLPKGGESAAELAVINTRIRFVLADQAAWYDALLENLDLARSAGLDVSTEEAELRVAVSERAANTSTYLELSMQDLEAIKNQVRVLPDDAETKALFGVMADMVALVAAELKNVTQQMDSLNLDSSQYRSQLIAATGLLSSDVLSAGVIAELFNGWLNALATWTREHGVTMVFNLFLFIILLFAARFVSRWVRKGTEQALRLSDAPLSTLLQRMIVSSAASSVYIIGVLVALSQIGISLGPILTGLGIAGFIVGFALQDTLSNFASGLMILLYRPFDVGDWIIADAEGVSGEVSSMSLVNTTIMTIDNQTLIVPNSKIWGNVIKNVTGQRLRRIDFRFGVSYGASIPHVEEVLMEIVKKEPRIFDDPIPIIRVHELGDSSVNFVCRPWVKTEDYWEVYWAITREVKLRFDEEGIGIPFPQRDVHFYPTATKPEGEQT